MKAYLIPTLALLTSCGTVVNGPCQTVAFTSTPSHANVYVDQVYRGTTPIKVKLERKEQHIVRMELENYQPYQIVLDRRISKWILGNVIFGGIIGVGVDAISGGMYKLDAQAVHAEIGKGALAHLETEDGPTVVVVEKADPSWEKIGQLERRT